MNSRTPFLVAFRAARLMRTEQPRNDPFDPDVPDGSSGAEYLLLDMHRDTYYRPTEHGHEAEIGRRLKHWARLRAQRTTEPGSTAHGLVLPPYEVLSDAPCPALSPSSRRSPSSEKASPAVRPVLSRRAPDWSASMVTATTWAAK